MNRVLADHPRILRVRASSQETPDTVTLRLAAEPGFDFQPGQFNMLYAFGVGEVPISISGDPAKPDELVHTVRAVGAVSAALAGMKRGQTLGVRGPFGTGWPLGLCSDRPVVVVAGGLGLAPLRPAILRLLAGERARGLTVLHGARTPGDLLFQRDLAQWSARIDVRTTVDRADPDWTGRVGVVPALLAEIAIEPATVALVCGPDVMMRFTVRELERRGVPAERIFVSLERNMKCGVGLCGHCQLSPLFICKDGPVLRLDRVKSLLDLREI